MFKFSVVVPVYNVEYYLRQCVLSILNQDFQDYELILVDDGSTDQSGLICDELALLNKNISVIHKSNGGLSEARNVGISKAKGEYLIFIDSDDHIEPKSFNYFYNELEKSYNPDVLITRVKEVYRDTKPKYTDLTMPIETLKRSNKHDIIKWMFRNSNKLWAAVRYILRKSFIDDNNLNFAVGYFHEDIDWTSKIFLYAKSFSFVEYYWYNHRIGRQGSICTHIDPKRILDVLKLVACNIKDERYNALNEEVREIMFQRMVKSLYSTLNLYRFCDNEERKQVVEYLRRESDILKYTHNIKHKLFLYFCKIFGFSVGLEVMQLLHINSFK